ncbi:MAG TPA: ribosome maturation factor RimP [Verrucomicrobiae bacterium]|nr:ribosome maturation factor RimP [Verrucomicrobiae bacterium]
MALDVDRVRELAQRVAASSGLEVVEVEFLGGGKARMLRVFLDKKPPENGSQTAASQTVESTDSSALAAQGITHEDCANFSREFGTILDVEEVMPGSYTLEVSSPGLDRRLTKAADFACFVGSRVKLMTREPVNGNRHFEGRLEKFEDGRLTLDLSVAGHKSRKKMGVAAGQMIEIDFANVEKANLVPEI